MIGEMSFICLIFAVRPLGSPEQSLGKGVGAKPSNNFFLYIEHTEMVIVRVNIG